MNKEQFLAMSLPYGLKVILTEDVEIDDLYDDIDRPKTKKGAIWEMIGINNTNDLDIPIGGGDLANVFRNGNCWLTKSVGYKPILHQLSDLTKEIEHKGEKFVPIMRIYGGEDYMKYDYTLEVINKPILGDRIRIIVKDVGEINFGLKHPLNNLLIFHNYQQLIEWHFAIGLDESEYIGVNTLPENPYK